MCDIPRPSIQEALFLFKPQNNSLQELLLFFLSSAVRNNDKNIIIFA